MATNLRLAAASRTHVGLVRRRNEDSFYQGEWLYAVADGLGGHVAGNVASRIVIDTLETYDGLFRATELSDVLGRAISHANEELRRRIQEEPDLAGMGATLVAVLRSGNDAVVANVGDSRAYMARNGSVIQLTEDHTYRHVVANADAVPGLPEKLARFLDGRRDGRSPDLTTLQLRPDDRVLLCSDGLSSYVPPHIVTAVLASPISPDDAADSLVSAALSQGGPDNVTVVVFDVLDAADD